MKNICMSLAFNAIGLWLCISSCNMLGEKNGAENPETGKGRLHIAFSDDYLNSTRAVADIPDTGDFRLTITDSGGNILYEGNYCDSPESLEVDEGSYIVRAVSCEFSMPAFSSPQFGDEQCVLVRAGKVTDVKLDCSQMNSGIRLKTDPAFLSSFPAGSLFLKSSSGKLLYSYSESRTAYFSPGSVSLVLSNSGSDETLLTRTLAAGDMLTLKVTVADSGNSLSSGRISIAIDTVRNWISESYAIGGENDRGTDVSYAMTVSQAMDCIGSENVWVSGYIVGGDLTSSSASFELPFSSRTNCILASRTSTADREACLSVQLPSGDIRDALNLVDNPELLGRKVCVKGDIVESYFGMRGVKNVTEYQLF